MSKFFFSYGTDPAYPFLGGWTEIEAPDRPSACKLFQIYHPNRPGSAGRLNCADIYSEDEFMDSELIDGNFGAYCHERITLTREILTPKDGRW